ncbi:cell wall-associated hydrolase, invasion-associated protein [Mycobacteroides abscessus subsp. abscessus]|uniref:NlpC/P60 family protein n=1 Tax=Mycobacteroides abscessus TaxID=36809 RepID=UPI000928DA53|nr:NlpC/P60 family protein [Mycobacteroides abscessus]MBN7329462.1 C40 family peptidase [Mycobacteroides abscessus subsp. abscessus]SHQ63687.1 cell wall-associated hydrolase, invasion-associated protein [Mycobacteroides abscessus subsp. abscessus]SHU49068.1 cell wall-associated hydrolase, invasion-associated protein [Mycobacteroides abscessus subsp. abscessus]SIA43909.1 cell wall-associated hydrolase, invasion-associated protein [Mycobacteroides abscessus subsp. abscessus]SIG16526.1 cell wall-
MAKIGDIRHWKAETLEKLFDTASAKAASLHRLGEGMEQVANDLSTWGGVTAGAWQDSAGKTRVDLGDKADAAEKVAKAVQPAIDDVRDVTNKLKILDDEAQQFGLQITDDGKVVATRQVKDTERSLQDQHIAALQQQVTALEQRATGVEQEIAAALRVDVTDAPAPPAPPKPDQTINASAPVPGPDGNPPYPNGNQASTYPPDATTRRGSSTTPMADSPPGYPALPAGGQNDQNWRDYLNGKEVNNGVATQRPYGQLPAALPNPAVTNDPALRTVGAAGRQQGVRYAWGANDTMGGPVHGTLKWDQDGMAAKYHDDKNIGYDCGGLARFAVGQGYGPHTDIGAPTSNQFAKLPDAIGGPQPGDLGYFGAGGKDHVAINLGNGVVIEAWQSGNPVELLPLADTIAGENGNQPQWKRP